MYAVINPGDSLFHSFVHFYLLEILILIYYELLETYHILVLYFMFKLLCILLPLGMYENIVVLAPVNGLCVGCA
jgi:hypothetical protein